MIELKFINTFFVWVDMVNTFPKGSSSSRSSLFVKNLKHNCFCNEIRKHVNKVYHVK